MTAEVLRAIPPAGWALLFLLALIFCAALAGLYRLLLKKEVRLKDVEIHSARENSEAKKELVQEQKINAGAGSISVLCSQYTNAVNLLQKLPIMLYEAGRAALGIEDRRELFLLLDVARLVEGRISREVLFDLARNHIAEKDEASLAHYAEEKAKGYWWRAHVELARYSAQFDEAADVPSLMHDVPVDEWTELFSEIYVSAAKIAK